MPLSSSVSARSTFQTNSREVEATHIVLAPAAPRSFRRTLVRLKQEVLTRDIETDEVFQTNSREVEAGTSRGVATDCAGFRRTLVRLKRPIRPI